MHQTASHRKTDAFLLGEALTHWFAQRHLGATVVVPLEHHSSTLVPAAASTPYPKSMPKYFRHTVKAGIKSEPDFLAFSTAGQVHVLECKGRAGFNSYGVTEKEINAARNKALRQVCKIATVNGLLPITRTACVFAFDQSGLVGQITDPPETHPLHYTADWPQLIRQAYATVLDPLFVNAAEEIGGNYIGIEFLPGWRFGINRHVYKLVQGVKDADSARNLLSFLADLPPDPDSARFPAESSAGGDGHILIGGPDYSGTIWSRKLF